MAKVLRKKMAWLTYIKCTEKGKESLKKKGIPKKESLHLHMVDCMFEKATVHPQIGRAHV